MTDDEKIKKAVEYWMAKANEALDSANAEFAASRLSFAINRAYYACYYAATAIMLRRGKEFTKHSGVRAAVHQHLIKTGELSEDLGRAYDNLFEERQEGDYIGFTSFESEQVVDAIAKAVRFVDQIEILLA